MRDLFLSLATVAVGTPRADAPGFESDVSTRNVISCQSVGAAGAHTIVEQGTALNDPILLRWVRLGRTHLG